MKCPKCDGEFSADLIATAKSESRISMQLTPASGELFDLRTIGGTLTNFSKLLEAAGEGLGMKTVVLLEQLEKHEDGILEIHCIVCRHPTQKPSRKRKV